MIGVGGGASFENDPSARGDGDDRKARPPAADRLGPASDTHNVISFAEARRVLRAPEDMRQAGFGFEMVDRIMPKRNRPVLFEDGPAHHQQRSAIARFFAPKVVKTRYRDLMIDRADQLMAAFRYAGRAELDRLSFEISVAVAAEIVGLTASPGSGLARRLERFFSLRLDRGNGIVRNLWSVARAQVFLLAFYVRDVRPAVRARRREAREDVISHLIAQGYANREIMIECLTYGAAGMATTREFIVMAAWHLLERPELRERFMATNEAGRIAILEEILRLEPVVGMIFRRTRAPLAADETGRAIASGTLVAIDVRAANADPAVGGCPHKLDPDRRATDDRASGAVMSFGDGVHRCPGGTVAMLESAIFLERLLALPEISLETPPRVTWNPLIASYELRGAVVTCANA